MTFFSFFFFFEVLGFELRVYTLTLHQHFFVKGFSRYDLRNYLLRLASSLNPADLYLLSN
jgi:hypothetical protein